jgi:hypothetical protein
MHAGAAADEAEAPDGHVSREHDVVREHNIVRDVAIVTHVGVRHEKTARANGRRLARVDGAVERAVFADHRVGTDHDLAAGRGIELQVLRIPADHGERMDDDTVAEDRVPGDQRVGVNDAAGAQCRARFDYGRGVNHRFDWD